MTETERYMIQALVLMGFALSMVIYMFYLRQKYQKQSVKHVQVKFITEHSTCYKKLLEVVDGFITLPGSEKKGIPSRDYPVGGDTFWQIEYPEGWIPAFLRTTIREMLYRLDTCEPIYNRGDPILSPELLHSVRREKFSEMGARKAFEEAEEGSKKKKREGALNPTMVYLMLGATVIGVLVIGVFLYYNLPEIKELLKDTMQALGV